MSSVWPLIGYLLEFLKTDIVAGGTAGRDPKLMDQIDQKSILFQHFPYTLYPDNKDFIGNIHPSFHKRILLFKVDTKTEKEQIFVQVILKIILQQLGAYSRSSCQVLTMARIRTVKTGLRSILRPDFRNLCQSFEKWMLLPHFCADMLHYC
jgi:hypothetical protein